MENSEMKKTLIAHMDLTNLDERADEKIIDTLCQRALTPLGPVAAVCVFPHFVKQCKEQLTSTPVKIATVANFPLGNTSLHETCKLIETAISHGADEIDLVLPFNLLMAGETKETLSFLKACEKHTHPQAKLKVILETGVLKTESLIKEASQLAIDAGADFIKTSTGKVSIGATVEAAKTMLQTIKESGADIGFKASGGITDPNQAQQYYALTSLILEKPHLTQNVFRLGVSRLLDQLLAE